MRRLISISILTLLFVAVQFSATQMPATGEVDDINWENTLIGVGVRKVTDGGNFEPTSPSAGSGDQREYEYRFACTEGDSLIFDACSEVMPACASGAGSPDGTPGTAIYWYYADTAFTPPLWTYFSGPECIYGEEPRDILAEIAGMIAHEFQQTPIAPAEIGSQPGPHTLRGKDTNVWAQAATQTFNLTLLDQQVTITARPVAYTWNYGDGTTWGPTPIHGAPLHQDRIGDQTQTSHVYTATGRLAINLTTHFDGSYSVNGGPQLPIPGQGNIGSPALPLTVWRAETHLYAENCNQNPGGTGC